MKRFLGLRVKRRIDRHNVTNLDHVLDIRMPGEIEFLLDRLRQAVPVIIMQMHVEGLEAAKDRKSDAAGSDRADMHALNVNRSGQRSQRCSSRPSLRRVFS